MIIKKTKIEGVFLIEIEKNVDGRGFFARIWDDKEFKKYGMVTKTVQSSTAFNKKKGTLRGFHYQKFPYGEIKIVRCTAGKIYDVILDLRKKSKTYKKWQSFELSQLNHKVLYIPKGIAHAYQTLENNTEIFYNMSQYYKPNYEKGIRWDDPSFRVSWPLKISKISKKDSSFDYF